MAHVYRDHNATTPLHEKNAGGDASSRHEFGTERAPSASKPEAFFLPISGFGPRGRRALALDGRPRRPYSQVREDPSHELRRIAPREGVHRPLAARAFESEGGLRGGPAVVNASRAAR